MQIWFYMILLPCKIESKSSNIKYTKITNINFRWHKIDSTSSNIEYNYFLTTFFPCRFDFRCLRALSKIESTCIKSILRIFNISCDRSSGNSSSSNLLTAKSYGQFSWDGLDNLYKSLLLSWCASTWEYFLSKECALQWIMIFLRMSECLHCDGILSSGRFSTWFNSPRQSENICTNPCRLSFIVFTARRIRWIVSSPNNSPLYANAAIECSRNPPVRLPWPLVHSRINAHEFMFG